MLKALSQHRSFHVAVLTMSLGLVLAGCRWFPTPHHGPGHPPGTTTTTGAPATTTTWAGSTTTASWPSSTTTTVPEPTTTTTRPCAPPDDGSTASAAADDRVFVPATAPPSTTTTSWPSTTIPPTTTTTDDTTDTTEPDTTTTGDGTGGIVVDLTVLVDNCPDGLIPLVDQAVCADSEEYSCTSLDADGYAQLTGLGPTVTVIAFPNDTTLTCPSVTLSHGDPAWNFEWQTATIICTHE